MSFSASLRAWVACSAAAFARPYCQKLIAREDQRQHERGGDGRQHPPAAAGFGMRSCRRRAALDASMYAISSGARSTLRRASRSSPSVRRLAARQKEILHLALRAPAGRRLGHPDTGTQEVLVVCDPVARPAPMPQQRLVGHAHLSFDR